MPLHLRLCCSHDDGFNAAALSYLRFARNSTSMCGMLQGSTRNPRAREDQLETMLPPVYTRLEDLPLLLTILPSFQMGASVAFPVAHRSGHNRIAAIACHRTANWDITAMSTASRYAVFFA